MMKFYRSITIIDRICSYSLYFLKGGGGAVFGELHKHILSY